jgi:tRNA threonylcarbamoyladenosine biosynthesis protein TsaE
MERVFTLHEISDTAKAFWHEVGDAPVLAFHGVMGAGKTTFIHALCDARGVKDRVSSPTFSLVNEYVFSENGRERKIYHIDLYRLNNEAEAIAAGIEDCLYSDHTCLVEWPEKISTILPAQTKHVFLEIIDNNTRRLRIEDK